MRIFVLIVSSLVCASAGAQGIENPVAPGGGLLVDKLIGAEEAIFSALLLLTTFFSYMIPGLSKIQSKHIRALAIGLTLVFAFVTYHVAAGDEFNIGQVVNYVITYVLSTSAYDKIFKPVGLKSPSQGDEDAE
jgi:hypothetical protein